MFFSLYLTEFFVALDVTDFTPATLFALVATIVFSWFCFPYNLVLNLYCKPFLNTLLKYWCSIGTLIDTLSFLLCDQLRDLIHCLIVSIVYEKMTSKCLTFKECLSNFLLGIHLCGLRCLKPSMSKTEYQSFFSPPLTSWHSYWHLGKQKQVPNGPYL